MHDCLVVIFNHRYDDNIIKIRKLYGERFDKIVMLMPFYDGKDPDVIPVYESSFQFEGYLIQAYEKLREIDADNYIFIGDDVCLHPELSGENIERFLNFYEKKVFIATLYRINTPYQFAWPSSRDSSIPFFQRGTRWKSSVPDYADALKCFEEFYGEKYNEEYTDAFFEGRCDGEEDEEHRRAVEAFLKANRNTRKIPYPMGWGYCDFFVITREQLFSISRLCGVFSAMNMFVEIAIPTAIILTTRRRDVVLLPETGYKWELYWGDKRKEFEDKYHKDVGYLYENWNPKTLFVHPVKLSAWSLEKGKNK